MTSIAEKQVSGRKKNDDLKKRVLNVKDVLPRRYTDLVIDRLPHLNNPKGRKKIYSVLCCRDVSEEIVAVLEKIALKK